MGSVWVERGKQVARRWYCQSEFVAGHNEGKRGTAQKAHIAVMDPNSILILRLSPVGLLTAANSSVSPPQKML